MRETDDFKLDVEFGKWLSDVRKKANLTVKEVAAKSGISEGRLLGLEMGYSERGIKAKEAKTLAELYGISVDEILGRALGPQGK